jgi:hypothetical protein
MSRRSIPIPGGWGRAEKAWAGTAVDEEGREVVEWNRVYGSNAYGRVARQPGPAPYWWAHTGGRPCRTRTPRRPATATTSAGGDHV